MKWKSALVTELSGTIGGLVASHNKGGNYFRARSIPVNTNTDRQNEIRTNLNNVSANWRMLSPAERAGWETLAANSPYVNSLGQTHHLSGHQMYNKVNVPRAYSGLALVDTAPLVLGGPAWSIVDGSYEVNPGTGVWTVDVETDAPIPGAGDLSLFRGLPQNPGVSFYNGPYQYVQSVAVAASASTATFSGTYGTGTDAADHPLTVAPNCSPIKIAAMYDDGTMGHNESYMPQPVDTTPP